jgi:hypothetical protein
VKSWAAAWLGALVLAMACGCAPAPRANLRVEVIRLHPGDDILDELTRLARERSLDAAVVLTCVGSVREAAVRFADAPTATALAGKREVVSLVGTLARGGAHLHIALSDGAGATVGGHLARGTRVYTTAEVAIGILDDVAFERERDAETGYFELAVRAKPPP